MLGSVKGRIKIKLHPEYTTYFWGDISEIAGKVLPVFDKNEEGDCLCFVEGKGLVDVDHRDREFQKGEQNEGF